MLPNQTWIPAQLLQLNNFSYITSWIRSGILILYTFIQLRTNIHKRLLMSHITTVNQENLKVQSTLVQSLVTRVERVLTTSCQTRDREIVALLTLLKLVKKS